MNIVVFGATGMVGTCIAAELEQRGHAVTAATRATGGGETTLLTPRYFGLSRPNVRNARKGGREIAPRVRVSSATPR